MHSEKFFLINREIRRGLHFPPLTANKGMSVLKFDPVYNLSCLHELIESLFYSELITVCERLHIFRICISITLKIDLCIDNRLTSIAFFIGLHIDKFC